MLLLKKNWIYLLAIALVVLFASVYTFNSKIDLNGDNCYYYILAKSLATGKGFTDLSAPGHPPTSIFPPGCPALMVPLMWVTDSITAQNALGNFFLLIVCLTAFIVLIRNGFHQGFALFIALGIATNTLLLSFATMTMSELPFAFTTMLFLFAIDKNNTAKNAKEKWIYLTIAILLAVLAYHIRTQGVVLMIAFVLYLLFNLRWVDTGIVVVGYIIGLLPWYLRNKHLNMNANRYLDQILTRAPSETGTGPLPIGELPTRIIRQLGELITKPLPESVLSYAFKDNNEESHVFLGILVLGVVLWGAWSFKRYRFFLPFFILGNLTLISLWSAPSGNRYLACFMPLLLICFYVGLIAIGQLILKTIKPNLIVWLSAAGLLVLVSFNSLEVLHDRNNEEFPPNYQNFQLVANYANEKLPKDAIFCVRKPELFYVMGNRQGLKYLYTENAAELIQNLVTNKVDYVVLDQLGFSSTGKYLYPAIQKYPQLFEPVFQTEEPKFYLLKLDKDKAALVK